jgi:hypothetical protein
MRSEQDNALGMKSFSHSRRNCTDVIQRSHKQKLFFCPLSGKRLEGIDLPIFPPRAPELPSNALFAGGLGSCYPSVDY